MAQESPFEPGNFITPTDSTESRPHLSADGHEPEGKRNVLASDGVTWVLEDVPQPEVPVPEPVVPQPATFTALEFLDLFTDAEQLAVVTATMSAPVVKLWYDRMLAAGYITIADERTAAGLDALVSAGLLTAARKQAIVESMQ